MGFRLRKSINLGGGFKINLSKSGIGYSWGIPGLRFTKMANGKQRTTYSIPGTGLSYIEENGNNKKSDKKEVSQTLTKDNSNTEQISSIHIEETSYMTEFLDNINKFKKNDLITKTIIIILAIFLTVALQQEIFLLLGFFTFIFYLTYRNKKLLININYDFDEYNTTFFEKHDKFFLELISCDRLWIVKSKTFNNDFKRNAGAYTDVSRALLATSKKSPYYLNTNVNCYYFSYENTSIYFLPDRVILESNGKTIVSDLNDFKFEFGETTFIESETTTKDSEITSYTWKYVNKNGSPDKRFKNNYQLPICNYGTISIKDNSYTNISILASSLAKTKQAKIYYKELENHCNKIYKYCPNCNQQISVEANFCKYCGSKQN